MVTKPSKCRFCGEGLDSETGACVSCNLQQHERTLVDWEIRKLVERDVIVIDPVLNLDEQLTPVGLDLRLDVYFREFLHMKQGLIDLAHQVAANQFYNLRELDIETDNESYYFIHPGSFVLAQSFEYLVLPDFICCKLGGRSSLAKYGIEVHATAERVDPGFKGHLSLELKNVGKMPVKLYPLQRVGNLMFEVTAKAERPYGGAFQGQVQIKPPKVDPDLVRLLKHLGRG